MILVPLLYLTCRRLSQFRRDFLPTDAERDRQYLKEARDLYDLEYRIRELDRMRRSGHDRFPPFGDG